MREMLEANARVWAQQFNLSWDCRDMGDGYLCFRFGKRVGEESHVVSTYIGSDASLDSARNALHQAVAGLLDTLIKVTLPPATNLENQPEPTVELASEG